MISFLTRIELLCFAFILAKINNNRQHITEIIQVTHILVQLIKTSIGYMSVICDLINLYIFKAFYHLNRRDATLSFTNRSAI